jgi:hypothetical protein
MEHAEPQAPETPVRIRGTWTQLTLELGVLGAAAGLLARIAQQIPDGRPDVGFVFAIALVLHASGFVRFARRTADFLEIECPQCSESFHGVPDRLPRPFRTRCAHCGAHA